MKPDIITRDYGKGIAKQGILDGNVGMADTTSQYLDQDLLNE